jgi:hypothetical protein
MNMRNNKLSHAPILQVLSWSPETDRGMAGCLVGPEAAPHCRADPPRWCLEAQSGPSPICQRTEGTAYVSNQQLSAASVFTKRRLCELIPMRLEKFFKSLLQIWILVNSAIVTIVQACRSCKSNVAPHIRSTDLVFPERWQCVIHLAPALAYLDVMYASVILGTKPSNRLGESLFR